jgi:hypothetical protein
MLRTLIRAVVGLSLAVLFCSTSPAYAGYYAVEPVAEESTGSATQSWPGGSHVTELSDPSYTSDQIGQGSISYTYSQK